MNFLFVGLGGFFGAISRFYVVKNLKFSMSEFPWGNLAVNTLGCFLAGILIYTIGESGECKSNISLFLIVGFLGSFTTFSSFAFDVVNLFQINTPLMAFINIFANLVLGLIALFLGYLIVK